MDSPRMIDIGGHNMHIFSTGAGEKTLVFMAGHGTSSPMLDFKPLWYPLAATYKIVVIEKFGYGLSDINDSPRDLSTLLSQSREALLKAQFLPPYILVPHSLSGLEAIFWAQIHPREVEAIIGLDPTVPETAKLVKLGLRHKIAMKVAGRVVPKMDTETTMYYCEKRYPSYKSHMLTEEDRAMFVEITRRSTLTKNMQNEFKHLKGNIAQIDAQELPAATPFYLFSSDFREAEKHGQKPEILLEKHRDFIGKFETAKHMQLGCGHYVHAEEPALIAYEIEQFIKEIT